MWAVNKAPFHTISLGLHTWVVTNDTVDTECQEDTAQDTLSVSSCGFGKHDGKANMSLIAYPWEDLMDRPLGILCRISLDLNTLGVV